MISELYWFKVNLKLLLLKNKVFDQCTWNRSPRHFSEKNVKNADTRKLGPPQLKKTLDLVFEHSKHRTLKYLLHPTSRSRQCSISRVL